MVWRLEIWEQTKMNTILEGSVVMTINCAGPAPMIFLGLYKTKVIFIKIIKHHFTYLFFFLCMPVGFSRDNMVCNIEMDMRIRHKNLASIIRLNIKDENIKQYHSS